MNKTILKIERDGKLDKLNVEIIGDKSSIEANLVLLIKTLKDKNVIDNKDIEFIFNLFK